jgi:hypothetical protein
MYFDWSRLPLPPTAVLLTASFALIGLVTAAKRLSAVAPA